MYSEALTPSLNKLQIKNKKVEVFTNTTVRTSKPRKKASSVSSQFFKRADV
jgi:hypothetical protein